MPQPFQKTCKYCNKVIKGRPRIFNNYYFCKNNGECIEDWLDVHTITIEEARRLVNENLGVGFYIDGAELRQVISIREKKDRLVCKIRLYGN